MKTYLTIAMFGLLLASGPARAATYDLTGTWSFTTTGNWVKGSCPKGKDSTGTLQITQTGDSFTMTILKGMVCNPASMCAFTGTIAGADYTAKNSAVVDTEGGTASNTITFTATSATAAAGADNSSYVHPKGMTCTWGFNISMSRGASDGGGPTSDSGVTPGQDAGQDTGMSNPDTGGGKADAGQQPKTDDDDGCRIGAGSVSSGLPIILLLGAFLLIRRRLNIL